MSVKLAAGCFCAVMLCLLGEALCQTFKCVKCTDCAKLTCELYAKTVDCKTQCYSQETSDGKISRGCVAEVSECSGRTVVPTVTPAGANASVTTPQQQLASNLSVSSLASVSVSSMATVSVSSMASETTKSNSPITSTMASVTVSNVTVSMTLCCNTTACSGKMQNLTADAPPTTCAGTSLLPGAWPITVASLLALAVAAASGHRSV